MRIVYLSRISFRQMSREGFRARRGNVVAQLIRSDRVRSLDFVWIRDSAAEPPEEGQPDAKLTLHTIGRLRLPFARSVPLLRRLDLRQRTRPLRQLLLRRADGAAPPVVLMHDPRLLALVPARFDPEPIVACDLIDDFRIHPHLGAGARREFEEAYRLVKARARTVFSVGQPAAESLAREGIPARWIPNGVDWDRYHETIRTPPEESEDLRGLPFPRVAFVGILSKATDHTFLNAAADSLAVGSCLFVGEWLGEPGVLSPRVKCLGFKPADQVHRYLAHIDVGLSLYKMDTFAQTGDSTKVYEYLAAGKPVVATASQPTLNRFAFVLTATDHAGFAARLREALALKVSPETISATVQDCSWQRRIGDMLDAIAAATHGRVPSSGRGAT